MVIKILTTRPEKYDRLKKKYGGSALFSFDRSADTAFGSVDDEKPDIVIVDPAFLSGSSFAAAAIRKKAYADRIRLIVGGPDHMRSLERELAVAGVAPAEETSGKGSSFEEVTRPVPAPRIKIGIAGLNDDRGAGFLAMVLAEELASEILETGGLVSVYAPGCGYFYRALCLDRRFPDGSFQDINEMIKAGAAQGMGAGRLAVNEDEGICWAVSRGQCADREHAVRPDAKAEFIDSLEGDFVLRVYTRREIYEEKEFLRGNLDALIAVFDPLPSKADGAEQVLEMIQECGVPAVFAVNKMNRGVESSAVLRFLGTYDAVFLPFIDPGYIYRCEYTGENPYRYENVRRQLMEPLCGLADRIRSVCAVSGTR
ncbi:MAG: hypothetical protein SOV71_01745 [Anaerovoracaceae bacterium]|nr:hypothetical protein [Bacillota bacterium]MDY2670263.1 hypothetical protein [Anaerovoracaceae bacterium]